MDARLDEDLRDVPFEDLQKLRDKLGAKAYSETIFRSSEAKRKRKLDFKRINKNRPREESSKIPVPVLRDVFHVPKKETRDPRYDESTGIYDERVFKQTYKFLDDMKVKEKRELQDMLKTEQNEEARREIKLLLARMENREKSEVQKVRDREKRSIERQRITKELKEGHNPFYVKKSHKKKLELAECYQVLKKSGNLDKYLLKKRKKHAAKDSKQLPN